MNTPASTPIRRTPLDDGDTTAIEQLTLLPAPPTPARFRLSKDTRERGLRHVAEIREMLAARADAAPDAPVARLPQRRAA